MHSFTVLATVLSLIGLLFGIVECWVKGIRLNASPTVRWCGAIFFISNVYGVYKIRDWMPDNTSSAVADRQATQSAQITNSANSQVQNAPLVPPPQNTGILDVPLPDYSVETIDTEEDNTGQPDIQKEGTYPLAGRIDNFAKDFNAKAKNLNLPIRFSKTECADGVKNICRYSAGSNLAAATVGTDQITEDVALVFGGKSADPNDLLSGIGILMAMYAPEASKDERAVAMKTLLEIFSGNKKKSATKLHGIRFKIEIMEQTGIWVFIDNARNKG